MPYWVKVGNLGEHGLIKHLTPTDQPLNSFQTVKNARFDTKGLGVTVGDRNNFLGGVGTFPTRIATYPDTYQLHVLGATTALYTQTYGGIFTTATRTIGGNYNGANWRFFHIPEAGATGGYRILAVNGVDVPQYYDPSTSRFVNLTTWPSTIACSTMRLFKNHLIGFNLVDSGFPSLRGRNHIKWSHTIPNAGGLPTSWDHTDATLDAGEMLINSTAPSGILDALQLGDQMVMYTTEGSHVLRYVGYPLVFGHTRLFDEDILGQRCVCVFENSMHFVLGRSDMYVHDGRQVHSILPEELRKYFMETLISSSYYGQGSYVVCRPTQKEIWVYLTTTQAFPNKILIWHYKKNIWTIREPHDSALTWADAYPYKPTAMAQDALFELVVNDNTLGRLFHDVPNTFDTSTNIYQHTFEVERVGFSPTVREGQIVNDPSVVRMMTGIRLWTQGLTGVNITVNLGASMVSPNSISYTVTRTFSAGTGFNDELVSDFELTGRWFALKLTITPAASTGAINRGYIQFIEFEMTDLGLR